MKRFTSCLGVVMGILLTSCSAGLQPGSSDLGNTMLTGRVLQKEADMVTLNLGELAVLQTPETAALDSWMPSDVTKTVRMASHSSSDARVLSGEPQAFISWQKDTMLDLSDAECFMLGPNGTIETIATENIEPQDILNVTMNANNTPVMVFVLTNVSQSDTDTVSLQGTTANLIADNTNQNGGEYESDNADENALRVLSANVDLRNVQISKTEGDGSDQTAGNRYGMNAALLATGGTRLDFDRGSVNSAADGGSGIFGHGNGTMIQLRNSTVTTTGDDAEGLQTSDGASIEAEDMTVTTSGDRSAVLRTEKGSLKITGGTYMSGGYHSPVIYSSGNIDVHNAELTANNSEAAILQGPCTVTLEDCLLYSNAEKNENTTSYTGNVYTVLIQGDNGQEQQDTTFVMRGGTLSAQSDAVFCANADCDITLEDVNILTADNTDFLRVIGTEDEHVTAVTVNTRRQILNGNLSVDSNSALQLNLRDSSQLHGAILRTADGTSTSGASVYIEQGCTWSLTGNSVVNSLENEGKILFNGYSITLGDGTVLTS